MNNFDASTLPPEAYASLKKAWDIVIDKGGEPRFDNLSPELRSTRACFHEAGHAAAHCLFFPDVPIHAAFVLQTGGAVIAERVIPPRNLIEPIKPRSLRMIRHMAGQTALIAMAGLAADSRYMNRSFDWSAERNVDHDMRQLAEIVAEWRLSDGKRKAKERACELVLVPSLWAAITDIALALKTEGAISGDRINAICQARIDQEALAWSFEFPRARKT